MRVSVCVCVSVSECVCVSGSIWCVCVCVYMSDVCLCVSECVNECKVDVYTMLTHMPFALLFASPGEGQELHVHCQYYTIFGVCNILLIGM